TGGAPICQVAGAAETSIRLESPTCPRWVLVNPGAQGYFRTAYSPDLLKGLAPAVAVLSEAERLSLVGDEWALVRAGRHTIADYLTLVSGLGADRASAVLGEVADRLSFAHEYLTNDQSRPAFEQFVRSLLGPVRDELGLQAAPNEPDDLRLLRPAIL